ncbi:MAG: Holliday junction branch migration protein RuvA, partial [Muribaculaceae bacterium]|nr:Holliday junction branch migration protein RuvA [Muribaculaceae bacterium]
MIEYLSGKVAELTPTTAVVDVNGVGYELNITLTTFSSLEQAVGGQLGERQTAGQAKLFVHEVIREDAWTLYGFASKRERELFRELIGVSGVGSASARMILSSISPAELEQVITSGVERRLKAGKGIGGKTAQRIIVDLRDKIKPSGDS